jgi:hypothetical protein
MGKVRNAYKILAEKKYIKKCLLGRHTVVGRIILKWPC